MPQWVKKMNETTYMVVEIDPIFGTYHIKENEIDVEHYTEEEILDELKPFGYKSMKEVEEIYSDMKNQIIAECMAENRTPITSDMEYPCKTPKETKEKLMTEYGINLSETLGDSWFNDFEEDEEE